MATIGLVTLLVAAAAPPVAAGNLANRSLRVSTSVPGVEASHEFRFTYPGTDPVGSVVFEYCQNSPLFDLPCIPPAGFDALAGNLGDQSGDTGFSLHGSTTANRIVISRPPAATTPGESRYVFAQVINPSTPSQSVYVRISTYGSDDATGLPVDQGALVFSTAGGLGVTAYVPPYLVFCVAVNVSVDCSQTAGNYLTLGTLNARSAAAAASQMAAYTNDETGYVISALGTSMTSGNNFIPPLLNPTASNPGTSQFGINLRGNSNPAVGEDPDGSGTGLAMTGYDSPNLFKFNSGDIVASSLLPTESNRYTVSYLVNIPEGQPPGIYTTTLTYVAVAQF